MKKVNNFGYHLFSPLLRLFVFICFHPKIVNKQNVPKDGFIFAGTHVSKFDALLIGYTRFKTVHFLAKKELTDKKIVGKIISFAGLIRVDRQTKKHDAINEAVYTVKSGNIVCIFPEGTINKTSNPIMDFKFGTVDISFKSGKPIVPFAIINKPKIFRYNIKIIFGKPYVVKTNNLEKETRLLEEKVRELIEEGNKYEKK